MLPQTHLNLRQYSLYADVCLGVVNWSSRSGNGCACAHTGHGVQYRDGKFYNIFWREKNYVLIYNRISLKNGRKSYSLGNYIRLFGLSM